MNPPLTMVNSSGGPPSSRSVDGVIVASSMTLLSDARNGCRGGALKEKLSPASLPASSELSASTSPSAEAPPLRPVGAFGRGMLRSAHLRGRGPRTRTSVLPPRRKRPGADGAGARRAP